MLLFIILFFVQFLAELALEIIINKLIFKNFFEISFLFKNWLVTLTYEGILYLFIFSSLYYINLFFLKLEKKYSIIYLFTILSAHGIIHYLLFRDSFFNVEFI